jgi:filamentous hemagglutinin family protein
LTGYLLLVVSLAISNAQVPSAITPDGTLGTIVTHDGRVFGITGGTRPDQGPNLFHSFGQFDVGTGDTAHFVAQPGVDNIIGRVTGGSASLIDGRLRSEASLFLLNPSGLMFGPHATLDVNGSFHASTADALRFADGAAFSARLNDKSTLTLASPAAFGFLSEKPAGIAIEGSRLEVPENETLSLVGGDVKIVGRRSAGDDPMTMSAPSGQINLVSVASPGNVTMNSPEHMPAVTVDHAERLGVIEVSQTALISVSGDGGGMLTIRGGHFLVENANIFADTESGSRGAPAGINVEITEKMILREGALLTTDVLGAGTAGNIEVTASRLEVTTGAVLGSRAWAGSTGNAGNIAITAEQLTVAEGGHLSADALSDSRGRAGTVRVMVGGLVELLNGGQLSASTFAQGNAGSVEVRTGELRIDDVGIPDQVTGIVSNAERGSSGHAGTVTVTVSSLVELLNGGQLSASTFAQGDAGSVTVQAGELRIDNVGNPDQVTGIFSQANADSSGDAGTVTVTVSGLMELLNGGQISSSTFAQGDAGSVVVQAGELRIDDVGNPEQVTGIFSQANADSSGDAGTVTVTVSGLMELLNGGQITSDTFAQGDAGDVKVQAGELRIDDVGNPEQVTGISSDTVNASGDAGTVTVTVAGLVELLNGAEISSSTFAQGDAGSVVVQAGELRIDDVGNPEQVTGIFSQANADSSGDAGTVTVTVSGLVELLDGGLITSSTFAQGDAGSVVVQAGELRIDNVGNPDQLTGIISLATHEATGLVGHIEVEAGTVTLLNGGTISIEARQTLPESQITEPIETRILISADHLHLDGEASITAESTGNAPASVVEIHAGDLLMEGESRIATTSNEASGGNIQVIAQAMAWLQDSTVTATVRGGPGTHGGNITMGSKFIILENSQIVSDAFQGRGGDIAIEAVVLLADPTSSVSAKARDSEVGIDGQVDIRALVTNLSGLVTPLPPGFAPAAELLRNRCVVQLHAGTVSSLVDRGRAGVPATPEGIQPGRLYQPSLTSAVPPKMERQPGKTEAMQQGMLAVAPVGGPSIISRPFPAHAPVTLKCNWTKP